MLSSTLARSSLFRTHRTALTVHHVPRCTLPVTVLRSMSSIPDSQHRQGSPSSEPTRDQPISSDQDCPTSKETSSSRISSDTLPVSQSTSTPVEEHVKAEQQTTTTQSSDRTPPLANVIDVEQVRERLRSWSESTAIAVRDRADRYTVVAAKTFAQLGRELNKATGYGEIESLKQQVAEQERRIKEVREAAREAKGTYQAAVQQRAKSQRDVNDLLQRKSTWTDDDVGRFTALVRQDHLYEQAETQAKLRAAETEEAVEREFTELMRVILSRYHEEQVWSDKIRSASTYGSLTVLGLNMFVFILAIIIVEPWKRKRLAQTFEKKVEELSAETVSAFESGHAGLAAQMKEQEKVLSQLVTAVTSSLQPPNTSPAEEASAEPETSSRRTDTQDRYPYAHMWTIPASAIVAAAVGWLAGTWSAS